MTGFKRVAGVTGAMLAMVLFVSACAKEESSLPKDRGPSEVSRKSSQEAGQMAEESRQNQAKGFPPPEHQVSEAQPAVAKPEEAMTKDQMAELDRIKEKTMVFKGPKFKKQIALTFDDGPDREFTPQILKILKQKQVPATFFVVGNMVKKYPDMLREIDRDGHTIGNHSFNHPQLTKLKHPETDRQIGQTNQLIYQTIHKSPLLLRPPYGAINDQLEQHFGQKNFKIIQWSVDTRDWAGQSPEQIMATVKREADPGGIILQHCAGGKQLQSTVQVLPGLIDYFRGQGYEFVTVDKLLNIPAYEEYTNKVSQ
ncbi:polysaccharide deacetylase family protein [Thermoactinomyces sp. CICC 10521]|jgi:peptidoglycan-N-acetylglucosamine deacetylase|nr:polysaccharide deacetylase family protein [Thermoactinomyces sp. CICC 10521]